MRGITRRDFMKSSMAAGAALALQGCAASLSPFSRARGANEDIRVAAVGFRSKGAQHIGVFDNLDGVRVVALCDPDKNILNREVEKFKERNQKVAAYSDVRKVLDDKNIDAIVTATPHHWHALITVWACQAGKDVYVEKPASYDIREGRKMVEAARKYKRIVQVGMQNRSDVGLRKAIEYIREGKARQGFLWVHGLWFKRRPSIGKVSGPQQVPVRISTTISGPARNRSCH